LVTAIILFITSSNKNSTVEKEKLYIGLLTYVKLIGGIIDMTDERPNYCPYCKENQIQKVGKYVSVEKGIRQRYKCARCGRTFYNE